MAGLIYEVNIPQTALTAATPTVVGFITTPANQRVKLKAYGFFFDGTTNSNTPIEIKLARPTTGTSASTQPTLTGTVVFKTITVHPQLGYEYIAPLGEEEQLAGGPTNWVASATAAQAVNIRGYFRAEE
jgi:hypothetical protein